MNDGSEKWKIIFLGQKNIQTTFLAQLLRKELQDHDVLFSDLNEFTSFPLDPGRRLFLVDYSFLSHDRLNPFLEHIASCSERTLVAMLNVRRENAHDELVVLPNVKGIFYNDKDHEHLLKGIKAILDGEAWFPRDMLNRYIDRHRISAHLSSEPMEAILTEKELQILHHLVGGLSNKEIANRLDISDGTVKTHIYNIFRKIGVRNRVQAVNWLQRVPVLSDATAN